MHILNNLQFISGVYIISFVSFMAIKATSLEFPSSQLLQEYVSEWK